MAWLKVDQTLRDHHKICDAADALQVDPAHMTGMMILFWLWAIDNAPSGSRNVDIMEKLYSLYYETEGVMISGDVGYYDYLTGLFGNGGDGTDVLARIG